MAQCSAHTALFNALMHLEGIESYTLSGQQVWGGHAVSLLILDGEVYLCDWTTGKGIAPYSEMESRFELWLEPANEQGLEKIKQYIKLKEEYTGKKNLIDNNHALY